MFGLDTWIARFSDGTTLALVGRRRRRARPAPRDRPRPSRGGHDADRRDRESARPARPRGSGSAWGLGHATTPVRLRRADRALPEPTCPSRRSRPPRRRVGLVIVGTGGLAARALAPRRLPRHAPPRRRRRARPRRSQPAAGVRDRARARDRRQRRRRRAAARPRSTTTCSRSRRSALFALCTALSMALLSTGFGFTLGAARVCRVSFRRLAPVLGARSASRSASGTRSARSTSRHTISRWRQIPTSTVAPYALDALDAARGARVRGAPRLLRALPRGAGRVARGRRGARLRRHRPRAPPPELKRGSWSRRGASARTSSRSGSAAWRCAARPPRPRSRPPSRSASASGRRHARESADRVHRTCSPSPARR